MLITKHGNKQARKWKFLSELDSTENFANNKPNILSLIPKLPTNRREKKQDHVTIPQRLFHTLAITFFFFKWLLGFQISTLHKMPEWQKFHILSIFYSWGTEKCYDCMEENPLIYALLIHKINHWSCHSGSEGKNCPCGHLFC